MQITVTDPLPGLMLWRPRGRVPVPKAPLTGDSDPTPGVEVSLLQ